jgi:hypothetical protein
MLYLIFNLEADLQSYSEFAFISSGQISFWADVFLGKCSSGQMSSGQMSFWASVAWASVFWANVFLGKCLSGQMSFWANVVWANVEWANVMEPYPYVCTLYGSNVSLYFFLQNFPLATFLLEAVRLYCNLQLRFL